METSTEFHYPGSNYTGPGTHIIQKILNHVPPVSHTDAIARQHDIDYLISAGNSNQALIDDSNAISRINDVSLESVAMFLGLTARGVINTVFPGLANFNTPIKGLSVEQTHDIGVYLNEKLHEENDSFV